MILDDSNLTTAQAIDITRNGAKIAELLRDGVMLETCANLFWGME